MRCAIRAGHLAIELGDPAAALTIRELVNRGDVTYPHRDGRQNAAR